MGESGWRIRAYLVTERAAAGGDLVLHVSDDRSASWDGSCKAFDNGNGADGFRLESRSELRAV